MKTKNYSNFILYAIFIIVFLLVEINYIFYNQGFNDIDFKGYCLASASFPFGIIKETMFNDFISPLYYLIIHFFVAIFKNEISIRIINSLIALCNMFLFIQLGKKLYSKTLGMFFAFFLCLNHFYLYYSHLIRHYCISFLIGTLLINCILDYMRKPNKKHFKYLILMNYVFILADNFGIIYVLAELAIFYLFCGKKKYLKKNVIKLLYHSFFAIIFVFPVLAVQYIRYTKLLIPNTFEGVGFSLSGFYLLLNEYISPYLSFNAPELQTKTTLGMFYALFLNNKDVNFLKLLIILFYSSIFPVLATLFFAFKACKKNQNLRTVCFISLLDFVILLISVMFEKIELHPIYMTQFFITNIILLGYGIFLIKDLYLRSVIIFCLFAIQIINPDINSYNILVQKKYSTLNTLNEFIKEYEVTKNDLIIMPYNGKFAKIFYKDLNFMDLDYSMLQANGKDKFIKNLNNKKAKTINKKNIYFVMRDYLSEAYMNEFLTTYFIENYIAKDVLNNPYERVILVVDKLNNKPVSVGSIRKCVEKNDYSLALRKINFKYINLEQNETKTFYDALSSKTLYNMLLILNSNYYLRKIAEYKKIDSEYYRGENNSKNAVQLLNQYNSDYDFLIFGK